jgi:phosphohistidine swiveling domain-containing protein
MQKHSKELLDEFFARIGKGKMFPPLNNYSLFYFGSGYNTDKYFRDTPYKNYADYSVINISDGANSILHLPMLPMTTYATEGLNRHLDDPSFIQNLEEDFHKSVAAIDALYAEYSYEKIATTDEPMLLTVIQKAFDLMHKANARLYFSIYFDKELCSSVLALRNYPITKERFDLLWEKAIIPTFRSFDTAQEIHAFSLLAEGKKVTEMAEACQYFYGGYKDVQPLSEVARRLAERYGSLSAEDALTKKNQIIADEGQARKDYNDWALTLTPAEKAVAEHCQTVMRVRDNRKNFFQKTLTFTWRIAEKIFAEAGVDPKNIRHVLLNELVRGSEFITSKKAELEQRNDGYVVFVASNGAIEVAYDNCAEAMREANAKYLAIEQQDSTEIVKGQIGSKGFAKGTVRIVLDPERRGDFKTGDILVTGMTRPEFVPLMKQASAIVTDEGGITCHAAIVSRELHKPCVIGTKIATKVFKDGDMVEVDANTGTVTKLSAYDTQLSAYDTQTVK